MATFWERAAHSVDHMFSLYFDCDGKYFTTSAHFRFECEFYGLVKAFLAHLSRQAHKVSL